MKWIVVEERRQPDDNMKANNERDADRANAVYDSPVRLRIEKK